MEGFDKEVIDFFKETGCAHPIDETLSTIMATLFVETKEISLDELSKKTGYSLASISSKIKILEQTGAIRKTRKPGTKKVFVYMEKDFLSKMKKNLVAKQENVIKLAKERLPKIIEKYKHKARTEEEKKKLKIIEDYYKQMQKAHLIMQKIIELLEKDI